jgi:hypothetical protein
VNATTPLSAPALATAVRATVNVRWRYLFALALLAGALGLALASVLARRHPAVAPAIPHRGLASLPLAPQAQISAALGSDQPAYRVSPTAGGFAASNPGQQLHARFGRLGVVVSSNAGALRLRLSALGYGRRLTAVGAVAPTASANRVSYAHAGVTEWYANGPAGLEQGFTIPAAPSRHGSGPLTLAISLAGGDRAVVRGGGRALIVGEGKHSLRYGGLTATDARGRTLHSWLALRNGRLLLSVDTRHARFPLRIDPFIQQGGRLTPNEEIGGAYFGLGVALSGDGNTALVGGRGDNGNRGAAWVFTREGEVWTEEAKLTGAGEIGSSVEFGERVALSSDGATALIGGRGDNGGVGAAWVFKRGGGGWFQQAKLTGTGEIGAGAFGNDVALSGDGNTALIGSCDNGCVGAAWTFTRSGSSWTQQGEKLTPTGEIGQGRFGESVSISGDGTTALIGGRGDNNSVGAAWAFARSGSTWAQQAKLTAVGETGAGEFGEDEALSGDGNTALIGAPGNNANEGAAWVFTRSGEAWTQRAKLASGIPPGGFGELVALSGDGNKALIGALYENGIGGAWLFKRSGSTWPQQGEALTGSGEYDAFGTVALSGDGNTALIGAPETFAEFGEPVHAGAAWVFANLATISKLSPKAGAASGGTLVTITGAGFGEASAVKFGSVTAPSFLVEAGGSKLVALSPPGAPGLVDIRVVTPGGSSPISLSDRFKFMPTVTNVSPNAGPVAGGTIVTISGSGFAVGTTGTKVKFGTVSATGVSCSSSTTCTATAPAHAAGVIDVKVIVNKVPSAKNAPADRFTYS